MNSMNAINTATAEQKKIWSARLKALEWTLWSAFSASAVWFLVNWITGNSPEYGDNTFLTIAKVLAFFPMLACVNNLFYILISFCIISDELAKEMTMHTRIISLWSSPISLLPLLLFYAIRQIRLLLVLSILWLVIALSLEARSNYLDSRLSCLVCGVITAIVCFYFSGLYFLSIGIGAAGWLVCKLVLSSSKTARAN